MISPELIELSASVTEVVTRNGIEIVREQVELAKKKKEQKEQQIAYEDIITRLIEDKLALQRYILEYQQTLEDVNITDGDIEFLHNTLRSLVKVLHSLGTVDEQVNSQINLIITLLSKDLLKTFQLIGFSYKEAIGRPLTELCARKISEIGKNPTPTKRSQVKR